MTAPQIMRGSPHQLSESLHYLVSIVMPQYCERKPLYKCRYCLVSMVVLQIVGGAPFNLPLVYTLFGLKQTPRQRLILQTSH